MTFPGIIVPKSVSNSEQVHNNLCRPDCGLLGCCSPTLHEKWQQVAAAAMSFPTLAAFTKCCNISKRWQSSCLGSAKRHTRGKLMPVGHMDMHSQQWQSSGGRRGCACVNKVLRHRQSDYLMKKSLLCCCPRKPIEFFHRCWTYFCV